METKEIIIDIIKEFKQKDEILHPEELISSGFFDSFDIFSLIEKIEKRFSLKLDGNDITIENFENISTISAIVERSLKGKSDEQQT
ncbi:hypothetical protein COV20_04055 [Candidatus Woesearchaeota archaeon CG10_big_fil_rev_8_21_14_0_10_45_16]|nr:MAG: hypothetical protein COV20_04055 [Candidatus Woesearchaeota archaeon CG10_big_fil_rev_8_21_14_0_10_45_16]